jgi:hypothetical protein
VSVIACDMFVYDDCVRFCRVMNTTVLIAVLSRKPIPWNGLAQCGITGYFRLVMKGD